jgi:glycosyltransferase involved in cell wall biosynthesis
MLWDKGVGEFVEAARRIREEFPAARFSLMGSLDDSNPAAIPPETVEGWVSEGVVDYITFQNDVRPVIAACDCVVLPSYREGLPRVLLEAAAIGRPIITTQAPGCKEVVDDGINGFLCAVSNSEDLAAKMREMIRLTNEERAAMGLRGRQKVESEFDEEKVWDRYREVIGRLTAD